MDLEKWKIRFATWQQKTRVFWYLLDDGSLRVYFGTETLCCPVTAEFDRPDDDFPECVAALDLDSDAEEEILDAADRSDGHDPELRAWLLEICGVQEKEAA